MQKSSFVGTILFVLVQISSSIFCNPYCSGSCITSTKCSTACYPPYSFLSTAANTCYVDNSTIIVFDA